MKCNYKKIQNRKINTTNLKGCTPKETNTLHIVSNYSKIELIAKLKAYYPSLESDHTCVIVQRPNGNTISLQF